MAVYLNQAGRMIADTRSELEEMAAKIGMRVPETANSVLVHYSGGWQKDVLSAGARRCDQWEYEIVLHRLRQEAENGGAGGR